MATLLMRDYGTIGAGNAAQDAATWNAAVNAARSGDTIHLAYAGTANDIKLPAGAQNRKSGVTFAFDEAIRLFPQGAAETFTGANLTNVIFGLGNTNGHGSGENAGKWQIVLDTAINAACGPSNSVTRFTSSTNVTYEDLYIRGMCETLATGQCTQNAQQIAFFAYPSAGLTPCSFITLRRVTADNCTYGYGLLQCQSGNDLFFYQIKCVGGSCLRIEQDAGSLFKINRLTADGVWGKNGNATVQLNSHSHPGQANWSIKNITSESMSRCYLAGDVQANYTNVVLDGIAERGGSQAQIAVSAYATAAGGGTTRGWKRGASEYGADLARGPYDRTPNIRVLNVFFDGAFANGGVGNATNPIPASRWGAGFGAAAVQSPPSVTAGTSSNITTVSASVSGTVDPLGAASTWFFEYGTTTGYGAKAPIPSGNVPLPGNPTAVSAVIPPSGTLAPSTTYHWRLTAVNSGGTSSTSDQSFATLGTAVHVVPTVTANAAGAIGQTSAALSGIVNPDGDSTVWLFDYGTTTSYGSTSGLGTLAANTGQAAVSTNLSGLTAGQTYHYRLRASNANGTAVTTDRSFATTSGTTTLHEISPQTFANTDVELIGGVSSPFASPIGTATLPVANNYTPAQGDVLVGHFAWEDGNPSPSGTSATTLYFRTTNNNKGTHVATEKSAAWTATSSFSDIRDLEQTRSPFAGVIHSVTTLANTTAQKDYYGRFISPALAVGTIDANTWTIALAGNETDVAANRKFGLSLYVENTAGTVVGYIYDAVTTYGTRLATGNQGRVFTVAGSALTGITPSSDKLVCEVWTSGTQTAANSYTVRFKYGGTADVADAVVVTDPAPYIQTPQPLFSAGSSQSGTYSLPAGWQTLSSGTANLSGTAWLQSRAAYHVVGNTSEPASYSFHTPSTNGGVAALYAFRGPDGSLLAAATKTVGTATSGTTNPGTVSTAVDGGAALYMTSVRSTTSIAFPQGWLPILISETEGSTHKIAAAVKPIPTAGASGAMNGVLGATVPWVAFAVPFDSSGGTAPPPPPPGGLVLTATLDEAHGRVRLLANDTSGNATQVKITRTHPSGRVTTVRGVDMTALIGSELQAYDYEVPIRRTVTYTATSYDVNDAVIGVSDSTDIYWDTDLDWLSDPLLPAHALAVHVSGQPTEVFDARVGVHRVLGRPAPVTTSQVRASASGQLGVFTNTLDEYDEVHLMTAPGHVLLLRTDPARGFGSLYFMPNTIEPQRVAPTGSEAARIWAFDYLEVDPPSGAASGGFPTWQGVLDTYATWQELVDAVSSWSDLVDGAGVNQSSSEVLIWRGA